MIDLNSHSPRGRYLLVLGRPTPNGRLHLGHIAGPYLKMDILARHLRRQGHQVLMVGGTDSYDSWILLKAYQTGDTPEDICHHFHAQIHRDFQALDINPDAFINPLSHEWSDLYISSHLDIVNHLVTQGATEIRREKMLYCAKSDRYIVGTWLLGKCPRCRSEAASYLCERCGAHFRPEEMLEPRSRLDEGTLEWREVQCLYLRLTGTKILLSKMEQMGVPLAFQHIAARYLQEQGPIFRLSQPGRWGVPWDIPGEVVPQVIFVSSSYMAYALTCGEVYRRIAGTNVNPFESGSGVTTITSCGIDITIPALIGGLGGALAHGGISPYDHILFNHFYNLEGAKFSTSRGHAIWATDIARMPTGSDASRCYLAKTNPEHGPTDFTAQSFVAFVNSGLWEHLQRTFSCSWNAISTQAVEGPPGQLIEQLRHLLWQQEQALDPARFHLSQAISSINTWVGLCPTSGEVHPAAYWWLKGLALLAYPIMPSFGTTVWQALGHIGAPTLQAFLNPIIPNLEFIPPQFRNIEISDLRPILPATLLLEENS